MDLPPGDDRQREAPRRRAWVWRFDHAPEAVWAVVADTARFNEAVGFPRHRVEEVAQADGSVVYMAHARLGPFRITWRDIPVEFVAGRHLVHRREFRNGPLKSLSASLDLSVEAAGTRLDYGLEAVPRGLLGRLVLPLFFRATRRTFERCFAEARRYLAGERARPFAARVAPPSGTVRARVDRLVERVCESAEDEAIARRLADFILTAPEVDVRHLRPLRLARQWGVPGRQAAEVFLRAAKAGLLGMEWVLLCPRCRGAKVETDGLGRLPRRAHCATCNIDYERAFHRNVELTFHPAPAIRDVPGGEFCLFGPMTTPHVLVQQTLAPGERRSVRAALPAGAYRLRTLHPGGQADIDWEGGGFPTLVAGEREVAAGPPAAPGEVRLVNEAARPRTLVVESRAWVGDALTGHRATTLQVFRELFPGEAPAPGESFSIEHITLMFTDLRGSTALYERIGDVPAYALVRAHFAYLARTVRAHNGAIVKTIGDAVMAAFAEPADGMRAALAAQANVAQFNAARKTTAVVVKMGLHAGAAIAVTLNGRLDYFGSTVNMAARLQGESVGGDVVLSRALADDPAVAAILAPMGGREDEARLRGFAAPVPYLRIAPPFTGGRGGGRPDRS